MDQRLAEKGHAEDHKLDPLDAEETRGLHSTTGEHDRREARERLDHENHQVVREETSRELVAIPESFPLTQHGLQLQNAMPDASKSL